MIPIHSKRGNKHGIIIGMFCTSTLIQFIILSVGSPVISLQIVILMLNKKFR